MKIGIISMQRVPNYGSFLQAYGLRHTLESLGHRVVFIDYKAEAPVVPYEKKALQRYLLQDNAFIKWANDSFKSRVLGKNAFVYKYRLNYLKQLGIGYRKHYHTAVDAVIIGSDEVFNCLQSGFNVGFSPMLFGQNINANKVISYAASFGYTDLAGLKRYQVDQTVSQYLDSFHALSVRDENSQQIVAALTGQTPELNLDPVLISDYELPNVPIPYHDYVILYTYKSRTYTEEDKQSILDFCKNNHKTLLSIGNAQNWIEHRVEASPLELLTYFVNADFIITDTFHGSVFSIKYNKPFATLIRDNNRQKLTDLLQRLKQENRIIASFNDLQAMYEQEINYHETNQVILKGKERAFAYLHRNLS